MGSCVKACGESSLLKEALSVVPLIFLFLLSLVKPSFEGERTSEVKRFVWVAFYTLLGILKKEISSLYLN